jgi:hypothetical protein
MIKHKPVGYISLLVSIVDYLLALYLYIVGLDNDSAGLLVVVCLILAIIALILGLIARFGREKDNFGVPGIISIVIVPILLFYTIVNNI